MNLEVEVVAFDGRHESADFDCGVDELNRWLVQSAGQQQKRGTCRTFFLQPGGDMKEWRAAGFHDVTPKTILGFYALASAQVPIEDLPPKTGLPRSVPVLRLCRLAVDTRFKGMGLGDALLMEVITKAAEVSDAIGMAGLFVDSKADARTFYERYGFTAAQSSPDKLWLPLKKVIEFKEAIDQGSGP